MRTVLLALVLSLFCLGDTWAQIGNSTRGWQKLGAVEGLLGDDWYFKKTRYCDAWASGQDLAYIEPIIKGLDASYQANIRYMGFAPRGRLKFYFFPMVAPAHTHPKFARRLSRHTRSSGVALSGTGSCVINLGSQRNATAFRPWEVESTCRHEMNHLFAFQIRGQDRNNSWGWLFEALAERIEETVLPRSAQMDIPGMKIYMRNYTAQDSSWEALVNERNRDDLEQYRDYEKLLASIVFFFEGRYGQGAVAKLMRNARGKDLEDAFVAAFGKDSETLEQEWKNFYGIR